MSKKPALPESGETPADPLRKALTEDRQDRRYLGREFLTWLLFYADDENGGGAFTDGDGEPFRVRAGERIVLKALGEGAGEITARGAAPAETADVRYAIAGGLSVHEADLLFLRGERTFQAAVTAELFDIKRAKLPALVSDEDLLRAEERLQLLDELFGMLRAAYKAFLRVRLQGSWESEEVPRLRGWLQRSILLEKHQEPPEERRTEGPRWRRSDRSQLN
jgi:hypothetical protein